MWCDTRKNASPKDGVGVCRKCGSTIVVLPNDRRHGYCYDCFDPLESDERIRFSSIVHSKPVGK